MRFSQRSFTPLQTALLLALGLLIAIAPAGAQTDILPTLPPLGATEAPVLPTLIPGATSAANPSCPAIVDEALARVSALCADTRRNQACYGNLSMDITQRPNTQPIAFVRPGDIADLAVIQSLRTAPLNLINGTWGVGLLRFQANLPTALPGQNVTMLVFGDVEIENATDSPALQSFFVSTSFQGVVCDEAPRDGIMLQTPRDAGPVSLTINDVGIELASTVFIGFHRESAMRIFTLEGEARVEALGVEVSVQPGLRTGVELENLRAAAPPSEPAPFDPAAELGALPLELLPERIELPTPPPSSQVVLPNMPTTGECVIATSSTTPVNIRRAPALDAPVVGTLDPAQTYPVIGRDSSGEWYQTARGWSAASVTRRGGNCANVPITFAQATRTPTPAATTVLPTSTPIAQIAGDNEYPNVIVPFANNQPVRLFGALSYPQGDRQDTVSYNWQQNDLPYYYYGGYFYIVVRCSGVGVEYATFSISGGPAGGCSPTAQQYNFQLSGFPPHYGSVTIALNGGDGAFVNWEVTLGFADLGDYGKP
jgi:hypothetical protein